MSFRDTNSFVNWMADTPASVSANIDSSIPDEQVGSLKPLTSSIQQDALGFSGPDFVRNPDRPITATAEKKRNSVMDADVVLDPSGDDFVPGSDTKKRRSIREQLVDKIKNEILQEYADQNARYSRALEFVNSHNDVEFESLDVKQQEKFERAIKLVERGLPMSETMAESMARKRASTQVIRVER